MSKKTAKKSEPKSAMPAPVYISPNDPELMMLVAKIRHRYPDLKITTIEILRAACRAYMSDKA
jgi:hypothetical protein